MKTRYLVALDDNAEDTPLSKLINFGPVTLPEFESMGFYNLDDLRKLGWEDVCRKWVEHFPERLNVNAFIGVIATLDGIPWTKISLSQKAQARVLVNELRKERALPPVTAPKRKRHK